MGENTIDEASTEREMQRSESEARDIIHDLNRLYTFPEERKTRWVWELLQNAKDVSTFEGINIRFELNQDCIKFKHDGLPFKTKHLLALLYKTSTKSLSGEGGTTGKYGTGFVTTHILNKKLKISGVHENGEGKRRFVLEIDRTAASLDEKIALPSMQESLAKTYKEISNITKLPSESIESDWHTFEYPLKQDSYNYAEKGLLELERNLVFTLLINSKIKSIVIDINSCQKKFKVETENTIIDGINFISLDSITGLLYQQSGKLIFGIPAVKEGEIFKLQPINNQAVLFKEFPLIGTEGFNLPVFIQHQDFHPTEIRDGVRTKIISEDEEDQTAILNRNALVEFTNAYIQFMEKLIDAKAQDVFIFAKSGLPEFVETYSNVDWYQTNIQKPIRDLILCKDIVQTFSGKFINIKDTRFVFLSQDGNDDLFSIAANLIPDQLPTKKSILLWEEIIKQDLDKWPENIILDEDNLVKLVPEIVKLDSEESFEFLKNIYRYLNKNGLNHFGEKYPIYPNEANRYCLRDDLTIHPIIDEEFKIISKGLGEPLEEKFLNRKVGIVDVIKSFDLNEFYNHLNKDLISDLKIEEATEEEIKAIFRMCSLFKSDKAIKRENWLQIIYQLLPQYTVEKKIISIDYENYWRSAELWSIKYICYLIEKAKTPTEFGITFFEGNEEECFKWLNRFLAYIFELPEENKDVILKRNIIPTQTNEFKSYDDYIYSEQEPEYFNNTIKDIYQKYTDKGNPRRNIIDTRIAFDGLRKKEVDILTTEIDKIFHDENIESKVKKGGKLNEMFLELNNWFEQFPLAPKLLSAFSNKRASLYVLALGEGFSKQIMEIQNSGKSIDDIKELAKIQLTVQEMRKFDAAASILGTSELLAKAEEMLEAKRQIDRWKIIGKAAETAFKEALTLTEPEFIILNPDYGKDFVIIANDKEYAIEIKSVDAYKGNVNMSLLQGKTAVVEHDKYALSVMTRPIDDHQIDASYFIKESRFVTNIGTQIGDKIDLWHEGLNSLNSNSDIKVSLDEIKESVYISRKVWSSGISFNDFIVKLKEYFEE
jgi:hypothetical protein